MLKWTALKHHRGGHGFTLVELLLVVALVMLLAGAMVFSFSSLLGNSQVEEGAGQVESLLRFARAQAANTGCKVQLAFDEETNAASPAASFRLTWEPDPLGQPGYFEDLAGSAWQTETVNGWVLVEAVQLLTGSAQDAANASAEPNERESDAGPGELFAPITFYPDGSSDSAEIVLGSRTADDDNRIALRIDGLSGGIRRQLLRPEPGEDAPGASEGKDTASTANPTSTTQ